jgi:hypothetical protein
MKLPIQPNCVTKNGFFMKKTKKLPSSNKLRIELKEEAENIGRTKIKYKKNKVKRN